VICRACEFASRRKVPKMSRYTVHHGWDIGLESSSAIHKPLVRCVASDFKCHKARCALDAALLELRVAEMSRTGALSASWAAGDISSAHAQHLETFQRAFDVSECFEPRLPLHRMPYESPFCCVCVAYPCTNRARRVRQQSGELPVISWR
jgi:hypothetical protein